ncbi:hypothetical protein CHUAL_010071 [Chamberlinius hualienensis]
MKLITHNMLTSKCLKGVKEGFPLLIKASSVKETSIDYNREYITRIIPKIDWDALYKAAETLNKAEGLPQNVSAEYENDETFLKKAHHVLLEVEVESGSLVCPETSREFPINDGIPNMLLNEDEV